MTSTTSVRRRAPRSHSSRRGGPNTQRRSAPSAPKRRESPLEAALDAAAGVPATEASFAELGILPGVVRRMTDQGITQPTEVQLRTLPDALAGRDILGRARTGSGKTLAFGLPLLAAIGRLDRADAGHPRALVLTPTRELAQQVADALVSVAENGSVLPIYGGAPMGRQLQALRRGVDVVVATPGRLEDHLRRGTCDLSRLEVLVIDEADHMADLGFLPAVTRILQATPARAQRMLFSATLDRGVEQVATDYLRQPAVHAAPEDPADGAAMEHRAFTMQHDDKVEVATRIASRPGRTLFFVRTRHGADRLAKQLERAGIATDAIHGNRNQSQRQRALSEFAAGRRPVLVATDVAARGIHVDDVDLVVHFDPPADHKDYLHRSGRTARAGRAGLVVSLLLPHEQHPHRRLHDQQRTASTPVSVHPAHPALAELVASGTPHTVLAEPARPPQASRGSGNRPAAGHGNTRPRRRPR